MEIDPQHELHRKAIEQIAYLLSSRDTGLISPHAFRVAIEAIWGVCGGVVDLDEFNELLSEADAEAAGQIETHTTVLASNDENVRIIQRTGAHVSVYACALKGHKDVSLLLEDQAAEKAAQIIAALKAQGMKELGE